MLPNMKNKAIKGIYVVFAGVFLLAFSLAFSFMFSSVAHAATAISRCDASGGCYYNGVYYYNGYNSSIYNDIFGFDSYDYGFTDPYFYDYGDYYSDSGFNSYYQGQIGPSFSATAETGGNTVYQGAPTQASVPSNIPSGSNSTYQNVVGVPVASIYSSSGGNTTFQNIVGAPLASMGGPSGSNAIYQNTVGSPEYPLAQSEGQNTTW